MSIEIKVPDLGDGVDSGDVLEILVREGERIRKDQGIVELETDKATVEVPSTHAGRVTKILIEVGQSVAVGAPLISLEADGAEAAEDKPVAPAKAAPAQPTPTAESKPKAPAAPTAKPEPVANRSLRRTRQPKKARHPKPPRSQTQPPRLPRPRSRLKRLQRQLPLSRQWLWPSSRARWPPDQPSGALLARSVSICNASRAAVKADGSPARTCWKRFARPVNKRRCGSSGRHRSRVAVQRQLGTGPHRTHVQDPAHHRRPDAQIVGILPARDEFRRRRRHRTGTDSRVQQSRLRGARHPVEFHAVRHQIGRDGAQE
jgi:pyruvate/2-oxoglutarate dehydrogenase complex dihydrolipoamide acyltransferase (E2) component